MCHHKDRRLRVIKQDRDDEDDRACDAISKEVSIILALFFIVFNFFFLYCTGFFRHNAFAEGLISLDGIETFDAPVDERRGRV